MPIRRLCPLVLLLTGACASIVSDNESTVYVATEPEKARCELHGQDFTRVVSTPASIILPSKAAPVTLDCATEVTVRRPGSSTPAPTAGWSATSSSDCLGGPIGLMIDASRGAGMKYPPNITIVLEPESFESTDARDRWYDDRKRLLDEQWEKALDELKGKCSRDPSDVCEVKVKKAERGLGQGDRGPGAAPRHRGHKRRDGRSGQLNLAARAKKYTAKAGHKVQLDRGMSIRGFSRANLDCLGARRPLHTAAEDSSSSKEVR